MIKKKINKKALVTATLALAMLSTEARIFAKEANLGPVEIAEKKEEKSRYRVIHWLEGLIKGTYEFKEYELKKGAPGQLLTPENKNYEGFEVDVEKTKKNDLKIARDETTVVNIYYKRIKRDLIIKVKDGESFRTMGKVPLDYGAPTNYYLSSFLKKDHTNLYTVWQTDTKYLHKKYPVMGSQGFNVFVIQNKKAENKYTLEYVDQYGLPLSDLMGPIQPYIFWERDGVELTNEDAIDIKGYKALPVDQWEQPNKANGYCGQVKYAMTKDKFDLRFVRFTANNETKEGGGDYDLNCQPQYGEKLDFFESLNNLKEDESTKTVLGKKYLFKGWYQDSDYSGDKYNFTEKTMPAENLVFFAKWEPIESNKEEGEKAPMPNPDDKKEEEPSQKVEIEKVEIKDPTMKIQKGNKKSFELIFTDKASQKIEMQRLSFDVDKIEGPGGRKVPEDEMKASQDTNKPSNLLVDLLKDQLEPGDYTLTLFVKSGGTGKNFPVKIQLTKEEAPNPDSKEDLAPIPSPDNEPDKSDKNPEEDKETPPNKEEESRPDPKVEPNEEEKKPTPPDVKPAPPNVDPAPSPGPAPMPKPSPGPDKEKNPAPQPAPAPAPSPAPAPAPKPSPSPSPAPRPMPKPEERDNKIWPLVEKVEIKDAKMIIQKNTEKKFELSLTGKDCNKIEDKDISFDVGKIIGPNGKEVSDVDIQASQDTIKHSNLVLVLLKDNLEPGTYTINLSVKSGSEQKVFPVKVTLVKQSPWHKLFPAKPLDKKEDKPNYLAQSWKSLVSFNKENKDAQKVETFVHKAYMSGYEDGSIKPEGNITRAEAAMLIARLKGYDLSDTSAPNFTDTKGKNTWYNGAVNALVKAKLMQGCPDGSFKPNDPITRGEFVQMIKPLDKAVKGQTSFADIKDHWAKEAIEQAYSNGRIKGYPDGSFKPNNKITRAEAVTILNNLFERMVRAKGIEGLEGKIKSFKDLSKDLWAYYELVEASNSHKAQRMSPGQVEEKWIEIIND